MLPTPCYVIDISRLLPNMEKIAWLREASGAKSLLALKCFATWPVFDVMSRYMDGTTSSSLYEVRLGREKFGKETHAYSVAYADHEIAEVLSHSDKIIFNTIGQLDRFDAASSGHVRGLRVNPGVSTSDFDLADPARPFSRLGEHDPERIAAVADRISGFMFHNNCENADFDRFDRMLGHIEQRFGFLIRRMDWISLGGGIHFTGADYPLDRLAERLRRFAGENGVQVYLEPGEAAIWTDEGDIIHLKRDRTIEVTTLNLVVKAAEKARFETPVLECTGEIHDRCDDQPNTMNGMRLIYNSHVHPENGSAGPTDPPNQQMGGA